MKEVAPLAQAHTTGNEATNWHARHPRTSFWTGAVVVYFVFVGLLDASLWRPDTVFAGGTHTQIQEAQAWWNGRLDLPQRWHDTALFDGHAYSHFPVLFTLIAAALIPFFEGVPHWFVAGVVVLPLPLLAYILFRRVTRSPWWGACGALGLVCGTSLWPVIERTLRGASPYYVNHALATIGLLLFLLEYFGRRRVALAGLGVVVASLSRQLTVAFALPLVWLAFRGGGQATFWTRRVPLVLAVSLSLGVPLVMNYMKFGTPLDTGYLRIYDGRDDPFAQAARTYGLFSAHFVPENLYWHNLGFPKIHKIEVAGRNELHVRSNTKGTGIWWTTPMLLWLVVDVRRVLADPPKRWLLVAGTGIFTALMFFHATGSEQPGFNRFSLDYMPAWLAVIMPDSFRERRRWVSLAAVAWSVIYFRWLIWP